MGNRDFYKEHWDAKRASAGRVKERGGVQVTHVARRLQVVAPYDEKFRRSAIRLGGKWRARTGLWSFQYKQWKAVAWAIEEAYGIQRVPKWMQSRECNECGLPILAEGSELCIRCGAEPPEKGAAV